MKPSNIRFDPQQPWWADYLPFLDRLGDTTIPACEQLNALLPAGLKSESGHSIRFVPSHQLDNDAYEHCIYTTGQVSTRPDNWHDFFNALVWMRFPRIKVAMNTLHFHAGAAQKAGKRGPLRDALTLFDECGVIVFSQYPHALEALAQRNWTQAFQNVRFADTVKLSVSGHAMLEKYLSPYKSMTAKALLVQVDKQDMNLSGENRLAWLDQQLAELLLAGSILTQPACLAPLPLAGVPGWWPDATQDDEFYDDTEVFRAPADNFTPAQITKL